MSAPQTVWQCSDCLDSNKIASQLRGQFVVPHGLRVVAHDDVRTTDVGLDQAFEFTHVGRRWLTLGEAGNPGDDTHFNRPTDIAFAAGGSLRPTQKRLPLLAGGPLCYILDRQSRPSSRCGFVRRGTSECALGIGLSFAELNWGSSDAASLSPN